MALFQLHRRDWRKLSWLGMVSFAWLVNSVAIYLISLRSLAANNTLIAYWDNSFMPMPPWRDLSWLLGASFDMLVDPVGLSAVPVAFVSLLVGGMSLFCRNWSIGLALMLPTPLVLMSSGLGMYPFGGRLLLFVVPIVFLLIAEGLETTRLALVSIRP